MSQRDIQSLVETIATQVMEAAVDDEAGLLELTSSLHHLSELIGDDDEICAQALDECLAHLVAAVSGESPDPSNDLDAAAVAVSRLQQRLADGPGEESRDVDSSTAAAQSPPQDGALVLPAWVDEAIFREFIDQQESVIEDIEADILALERGEQAAASRIKRSIHTMKGEAGVLGLDPLEQVCHGVEDYLDKSAAAPQRVDALLAFKDWVGQFVDSSARMRQPPVSGNVLLDRINGGSRQKAPVDTDESAGDPVADDESAGDPVADDDGPGLAEALQTPGAAAHGPDTSTVGAEPEAGGAVQAQATPDVDLQAVADPGLDAKSAVISQEPASGIVEQAVGETPSADGAPAAGTGAPTEQGADHAPCETATPIVDCVTRDEDTLELIPDFLQEASDGISSADAILLDAEAAGVSKESLDALFRVFHTIKGVAGFLNLKATAALAHATETLLNQAREDKLALQGAVLDVVFDATHMMRELIDAVHVACEQGSEIESKDALAGLLSRLDRATAGDLSEETVVPSVPVDMKLGEVLAQTAGIPENAVDEALEKQKTTGAPLGKQLIDDGAAQPKQVAQALRAQAQSRVKIRDTVKVDLDRVDNLVALIGELVIVESMVVHDPEIAGITNHRVRKHLTQLGSIARELQDVGMRMRMVPVRGVFQKMARMVRDLSRKGGKQINLELSGEGVEMDRSMVEQIGDPLVHMIRNAVDHGIEPPDDRAAADKSPTGQVKLSAYHEGGSIVIELRDDGRGLNRESILAKARSNGLVKESDKLADADIYNLIFSAGLSTAEKVTEVSGRGVGMDVVKRNIEAMRGRVSITSTPGQGTVFKMVLPLTLAIIDGMVVACGADQYIIPTLSIVESVQPTAKMLSVIGNDNELINLRGKPLPLLRLSRILGISGAKRDPLDALVVIAESGGQRIGILVDDVVTRQQVVIKSLSGWLVDTPCVAGAVILSDGNVGLILNVDALTRLTQERLAPPHSFHNPPAADDVLTQAAVA